MSPFFSFDVMRRWQYYNVNVNTVKGAQSLNRAKSSSTKHIGRTFGHLCSC
jgi:hypothetical protein